MIAKIGFSLLLIAIIPVLNTKVFVTGIVERAILALADILFGARGHDGTNHFPTPPPPPNETEGG